MRIFKLPIKYLSGLLFILLFAFDVYSADETNNAKTANHVKSLDLSAGEAGRKSTGSSDLGVGGDKESLFVSEKAHKSVQVRFLDPEYFDEKFKCGCHKHIECYTKDLKIGVDKIPVYDDALDKFVHVTPFDYELGFTFVDKYVNRGQDNGNHAAWQPYIKVSPTFEPIGNLTFAWWVNVFRNAPVTSDTEHDFIFDYNLDILAAAKMGGYNKGDLPYLLEKAIDFNIGIGLIYYYYPPTRTSTNEIYGSVIYNIFFHPYVLIINDYGSIGGVWTEGGITESFDLKFVTLSLYSKLGYNNKQNIRSSKLQTFEYGFSFPIPVGKHMKIEPFISHSVRLNKTYYYTTDEEGNEQGNVFTKNQLFGGFKYTINF